MGCFRKLLCPYIYIYASKKLTATNVKHYKYIYQNQNDDYDEDLKH